MKRSTIGRFHFMILVILGTAVLIAVGTVPVMAAEAPAIEWQKFLGGVDDEYAASVQQTIDGGYILFGSTWSNATGDITGTKRMEISIVGW